MVWKSNITEVAPDNDSSLEEILPPISEDKENQEETGKNLTVTIDARSSENYLDDVVEV